MLSLLITSGTSNFFQQYGILIVLVVALAILMFLTFNRRKKEEAARMDLNNKVKVGAKVKTFGGLYGKVVAIEETTDGKIVLLETGVGNKVSYQNIHINAIYGLDEKEPVVLDASGKPIFDEPKHEEPKVQKTETAKPVEKKETTTETKQEKVENPVITATSDKQSTTTKTKKGTTSTTKKTTTKTSK
jgi:preprotein translocase YajC subunit